MSRLFDQQMLVTNCDLVREMFRCQYSIDVGGILDFSIARTLDFLIEGSFITS